MIGMQERILIKSDYDGGYIVVEISKLNLGLRSTVIKGEDWTNHFISVHNPQSL